MHQHITDIAEQCAASETACNYQADRDKRREEYAEDHAEANERGRANQCTRVRVMGIVELLEEWDAMIDPSVYDILDDSSGAKAREQSESPYSGGFEIQLRESHCREHHNGNWTSDEITIIKTFGQLHG